MRKLTLDSEIFTRAVEEIITREELKKKLASGRKLRIKFGVDVTASTLHLGNAVNLWKMRELQEHGHKVVFLIGDFTTKIGDPTGRLEARKTVAVRDLNSWARNFRREIRKILLTDRKVFEVRKNSEWFSRMDSGKLLSLMSLFTHAKIMERDMFQRRIRQGKEIRLAEMVYPILQGYDSVMLKSDLTVIGSDQLFNENVGRFLQEKFGQPPQAIVTTVITPGIDGGPKMSKSLGNYIGLDDSPQDKFGKAMRVLDRLVLPYLEVYTDVPGAEIRRIRQELAGGKNPMEAKLFLAEALVRRYHGPAVARVERRRFLKIFSKRRLPEDMAGVKLGQGPWNPPELLVRAGLAPSKSAARRLILQGAVEIDGRKITRPFEEIVPAKGSVIRAGKRKFARIS